MGKAITDLKPQVKRNDRVSVFLDGEFGFGLHRSVAEPLRIGQQLDAVEIEALQRADQRETAHKRAVRLIAQRPHSEHELEIRLERQGMQSTDIQAVLQRLRDSGLADDLAFARAWIENRMAFRPRGARALRSELRRKGVGSRVIERALKEFDEGEAARLAAEQGARKYLHLSPEMYRRRLSAYLSRRGFEQHTITPLVRELAAELEAESEETT